VVHAWPHDHIVQIQCGTRVATGWHSLERWLQDGKRLLLRMAHALLQVGTQLATQYCMYSWLSNRTVNMVAYYAGWHMPRMA
jgi:hypothetical protein